MKIIRKYAEFVGYTLYRGERLNEWRCPNKKCSFGVSEDYTCCPYCGQKIKFKAPPKVKVKKIGGSRMNVVDITEEIVNSIEKKILNEWKHEGYIDGFTSDKAYVVIDGKRYQVTVQEVRNDGTGSGN